MTGLTPLHAQQHASGWLLDRLLVLRVAPVLHSACELHVPLSGCVCTCFAGLYPGLNAETMISSREGRSDLFIYGHTTPPDSQNAPKQSQL